MLVVAVAVAAETEPDTLGTVILGRLPLGSETPRLPGVGTLMLMLMLGCEMLPGDERMRLNEPLGRVRESEPGVGILRLRSEVLPAEGPLMLGSEMLPGEGPLMLGSERLPGEGRVMLGRLPLGSEMLPGGGKPMLDRDGLPGLGRLMLGIEALGRET